MNPATASALVMEEGDDLDALLRAPEPSHHLVQFYDNDDFLVDHVAQFLAAGVRQEQPVVVVATAEHRSAFTARMQRDRIDVADAARTGHYLAIDAHETLAKFMVNGMPDWDRFRDTIGAVMDRAGGGHANPVRAYGEMVNILWQQGNRSGATALEEMWNRLAGQRTFSLLCGYVTTNFRDAGDAEDFRTVCDAHTHVLPAEGYARLGTADARRREITRLQQRAHALEQEVERSRTLEHSLRQALAREQEARTEAEQSVRYNEMFAGMLGHDLRNPLNAIATAAAYVQRATGEPKTRTAATRIMSSSDRMARMIEQLLDFTRIRVGGGMVLHRTVNDLNELCQRTRDELEAAYPECRITITATGSAAGEWDRDRLLQVFSNVIGNAVHHGTPGCAVTITADGTDATNVTVAVHNPGVIGEEVRAVLFEPFRGEAKYQNTQGLGLGLYITQQIVAAHGGSIDVASSETDGTTVRLTLPRRPLALVSP
jgi:signal transduction histidine kinase